MVQSREVIYHSDFTGGLNLTDSQQSIKENESPDALNVDFGLRGGFVLRGGFQTQDYSSLYGDAIFLGPSYYGNDVVLMAEADGSLCEFDGSTILNKSQDLSDTTMAANPVRMANFSSAQGDKNYFANGRLSSNLVMRSWDDSTLTTLTNTFNDTYTSPAGGNMPLARHIASHAGYMWVADTVESATRYAHRVRFSHLQQPEDWATADYFEVDPSDDGDPITALVPFQNVLLVFKRGSVHAVFGTSRDNFSLEALTQATGVNDPRAIAVHSGVCYWFSNQGQLMGFNGRGVVPVSDKVKWWTDLNYITHGGDHQLMWADEKLWLSLETGSAYPDFGSVSRLLFMYDPSIRAMTRYDKIVSDMFYWIRIGQDPDPLFLYPEDDNIYRYDRSYPVDTQTPDFLIDQPSTAILDQDNNQLVSVDSSTSGNVRIDGYYRTGWFTASETATKKRWKRPRVTAAAEGDTTIRMRVYHDFDDGTTKKQSEIIIDSEDTALWNTMLWGDDWPENVSDTYNFARMPSAGTGHAVQFEFTSQDNPGRWWIDSIALPFRRKQVK